MKYDRLIASLPSYDEAESARVEGLKNVMLVRT